MHIKVFRVVALIDHCTRALGQLSKLRMKVYTRSLSQ